ncbi:MAG: energy transducer TonB [Enhydrobacter sp.]|nr:MAG: energy transducer TonB [Enhydrobacter sp.]
MAASLTLHAGAIVLALTIFGVSGAFPDDAPSITFYAEPGTADDSDDGALPLEQVAAAIAAPPAEDLPPPEFKTETIPPVPEPPLPPEFKTETAAPPKEPIANPPVAQPPSVPPPRTASPARPPPPAAAPASVANPASPSGSPSGPPASVPSVAPVASPQWNALMAAWLAARKKYPGEARRRGERGDVTIRFAVAADGRVLEVSVVTSSGFPSLDTAALGILRGATVPPPGSAQTRDVRIRYSLTD